MATITSAQSGDFSNSATWVGGVVPTVGDTARVVAGHIVTIDTNTTCDAIENLNTTGYFLLPNGITLTANVQGGSTSNGTLQLASGAVSTIVGNVTASQGVNGAWVILLNQANLSLTIVGNVSTPPGNRNYAIRATTAATNLILDITGNITGVGQNTTEGTAWISSPTCTITVTGNIQGSISNSGWPGINFGQGTLTLTGNIITGAGIGIYSTGASSTITITGNIEGNSAASSGVNATGASSIITVTGNITGGTGTSAFGISSTGASSLINAVGTATAAAISSNAISSTATTNGVVFSGNMISSPQGALPVRANVFRLLDTNLSGITQYADDSAFPTGSLVTRVSADLVQGMPSASDVRFETLYGVDNTLEGTLHMPTSGAVAFSVPVDDTVGVLATNASEIADEIVNRLLLVTEENNIVTVPYSTGSVNYSRTKVLDSTRTLQLTEI
jgi:hypothetical protein